MWVRPWERPVVLAKHWRYGGVDVEMGGAELLRLSSATLFEGVICTSLAGRGASDRPSVAGCSDESRVRSLREPLRALDSPCAPGVCQAWATREGCLWRGLLAQDGPLEKKDQKRPNPPQTSCAFTRHAA
jgi:hypothetical protein